MTTFWLVAAAMLAVAVGIVLSPLLRRKMPAPGDRQGLDVQVYRDRLAELDRERAAGGLSDTEYEQSRQELERSLLEDADEQGGGGPVARPAARGRWVAPVAAVLVPLLAVAMYAQWGSGRLDPPPPDAADVGDAPHQMQQAINRLSERLEAQPEDAAGWAMLGRSQYAMENFEEAVRAFREAVEHGSREPRVYADYADALAVVGDGGVRGRALELVQRALELDPEQPKALWLAGTAAFERGDHADAVRYWERLHALLPPGSEVSERVAGSLEAARARAGAAPAGVDGAEGTESDPAAGDGGAARVQGRVRLSRELEGRFSDDATVFVLARAVDGPRMPLAVKRLRVGDLPAEFALDDSMAMMPDLRLSRYDRVTVVARVSPDGTVADAAASGESEVVDLSSPDRSVTVVVDTLRQ